MSELEGSGHQEMTGHVTSFENTTSALPTTFNSCAGESRLDGDVMVGDVTNVVHRFDQKYKLIEGEKYFVLCPDGSTYSGILLSRTDPRLANLKLEFQQTPMDVEECPPEQQSVDHCFDSNATSKGDETNSTPFPMVTAQSPIPASSTSVISPTSTICPSFPTTPFPAFTASLSLPSPAADPAVATVSLLNKTNLRYHPYQRKRSASWTSSHQAGGPPGGLIVRRTSAEFTTQFSSMMSDNTKPAVLQTSLSGLPTLFSTVPALFSTSLSAQTTATTTKADCVESARVSPSMVSALFSTSLTAQATTTATSPSSIEADHVESAVVSPSNIAVDMQHSPMFSQQSLTYLQAPMISPLLHLPSSPSCSLQHSSLSPPLPATPLSLPQSPTLNRSLEMTMTPSLTLPSVPQSSLSMSGSVSPPSSLSSSPKQPQNEVPQWTVTSEILTGLEPIEMSETKVLEAAQSGLSAPSPTSSSLSVPEPFSPSLISLATPMQVEADEMVPSPAVSFKIWNEPEAVEASGTRVLEVHHNPSEHSSTSLPSLVVDPIPPETSLSTQLSPMSTTESMVAKAPEPMDVSEILQTTPLPIPLHQSPSSPKTLTPSSPTLFVNTSSSGVTVNHERMDMDISETEASQAELLLLSLSSSDTTLVVPSPLPPKSLPSVEMVALSHSSESQTSFETLSLGELNESSSMTSRPASPDLTAMSSLPGLSPPHATLVRTSESADLSVSEKQEMTSDHLEGKEKKSVKKKTEEVVQILSSDDEDDGKSSGKKHKTSATATTSSSNNVTSTDTKNNVIHGSNDTSIDNDKASKSVSASNGDVSSSNTDEITTTRVDLSTTRVDLSTTRVDLSTILVAVHLRQTLFGTDRNPTFKRYLVFIDRLMLDSGGPDSVTIPFTEVSAMYLHHGLSGPVFFLLLSDKFSVKLQRLLSICPTKFNPEGPELGSRYVTLIPSKRNALSPQLCDRNHVDTRLGLVKSYLEARFNHQVHLEMISGDRTSEILQAALIIPKKEPEKQMAHTTSCPDLRPKTQITPPPTPGGLVLVTETPEILQNQTPSIGQATTLALTNGGSGNVGILATNGNGIGTPGNILTSKTAFILVTRNFRQLLQPVSGKGGSSPTVFRFTSLPRVEPIAAQVPSRAPFCESIVTLFTYPPSPGPGRMSITNEDFYCLNDGEFLNDAIIDFYLKYILLEKLDAEASSRVHVFSSFFYGKLSDKVPEESPQNLGPTSQQIRHSRVKTWTRHVDIFSKDFLVVPINENAHWFLAIVCFPGLSGPIIEQLPTEDKDETNDPDKPKSFPKVRLRQSCILIFDSLGMANHFLVIKTLREYLQVEWDTRKLSTEGQREFSEQTVPGSSPRCPLQTNTSDCGVYLLQYVESFFQNPIVDFAMPIQNTANWFPQELVRGKRKMLQNLIIQLKEKLSQSSASPALTIAAPDQAT